METKKTKKPVADSGADGRFRATQEKLSAARRRAQKEGMVARRRNEAAARIQAVEQAERDKALLSRGLTLANRFMPPAIDGAIILDAPTAREQERMAWQAFDRDYLHSTNQTPKTRAKALRASGAWRAFRASFRATQARYLNLAQIQVVTFLLGHSLKWCRVSDMGWEAASSALFPPRDLWSDPDVIVLGWLPRSIEHVGSDPFTGSSGEVIPIHPYQHEVTVLFVRYADLLDHNTKIPATIKGTTPWPPDHAIYVTGLPSVPCARIVRRVVDEWIKGGRTARLPWMTEQHEKEQANGEGE